MVVATCSLLIIIIRVKEWFFLKIQGPTRACGSVNHDAVVAAV